MAEVITTLHPENDETIDLYPNIKKENIPANAIDASKIENEAITENKLDPALQAKLNDEVCILTLSGTSGLLSESSYNKLINAEIAFIVIDGKYYCRSYTTQSGSPAYNIYWFVNITYNDSIVQSQIAVNSSNRFWVLSSQSKLLTFYRDDLDKIIVEAVDVDDLNVTNNIDCLGDIDVEDVNASGLYSLGYQDGESEIGLATTNLVDDMELIKFVEGNTYAVNDVVFYNKNLYVCKTAYSGTGNVPDPTQDTTYWKRLIVDNKINPNLLEPTLLWENQAPTSSFGGGEITIPNLNDYNYIIVEYIGDNYSAISNYAREYRKYHFDVGSGVVLDFAYSGYINNRSLVKTATNKLTFGGASFIDLSGTSLPLTVHNDNKRLIPLRIYGTNVL